MCAGELAGSFDPVLGKKTVIIDEGHQLTSALQHAKTPGERHPLPGLAQMLQGGKPRVSGEPTHNFGGTVGAVVVDYDGFPSDVRLNCLACNMLKRPRKKTSSIVGADKKAE